MWLVGVGGSSFWVIPILCTQEANLINAIYESCLIVTCARLPGCPICQIDQIAVIASQTRQIENITRQSSYRQQGRLANQPDCQIGRPARLIEASMHNFSCTSVTLHNRVPDDRLPDCSNCTIGLWAVCGFEWWIQFRIHLWLNCFVLDAVYEIMNETERQLVHTIWPFNL